MRKASLLCDVDEGGMCHYQNMLGTVMDSGPSITIFLHIVNGRRHVLYIGIDGWSVLHYHWNRDADKQ